MAVWRFFCFLNFGGEMKPGPALLPSGEDAGGNRGQQPRPPRQNRGSRLLGSPPAGGLRAGRWGAVAGRPAVKVSDDAGVIESQYK